MSIETFFYFPNLRQAIHEHISKCDACQRFKDQGPIHSQNPPRNETAVPWSDVAVEIIGPWTIDVNNTVFSFSALTAIDISTGLFEIKKIEEKTSDHAWQQFRNAWLSRYPRPTKVIHDQGGEFVGQEFQFGLIQHGIKPVSITSKNPQANAVVE